MAAEELGIPVSRISLVDGDTGRCPNNGGTGGSTGLTRGGTAVRQAAASARQELLRLASQRLAVPAADLTIVNGEVLMRNNEHTGALPGKLLRGPLAPSA
jgi:CO/xanthine dehydrogenase Mo-binding subunit